MKLGQVMAEYDTSGWGASGHRSARFWWGWGLALGMTGLLLFMATLPAFLGPGARHLVMQSFSAVCHQIPERSPSLNGIVLAVCHRCYGIYWGLPLAAFVFLALIRWDVFFNRYAGLVLLAALIPTSLDWGLGVLGVWHNTPWSRVLTGGLLGLVAGYYLARALAQVFVGTKAASASDP